MKIADINPFVRYALRTTNRTFITGQYIMAYDTRIFYVIDGKGRLDFSNNINPLVKGDMTIIGPATPYLLTADEPDGLDLAIVNFDYTPRYRRLNRPMRPVAVEAFDDRKGVEAVRFEDCSFLNGPIVLHDMHVLETDVLDIIREFTEHKILYRDKASAITRKIIFSAARTAFIARGGASPNTEPLVNAAIAYMRQHYGDENLDNTGICAVLNYHPYYVSHLMKACTGMTLHQYLTHLRIRKALDLLTSTQLSVARIAEQVGFKSQSHFSYRFKKSVGKSPMAYRRDFLGL